MRSSGSSNGRKRTLSLLPGAVRHYKRRARSWLLGKLGDSELRCGLKELYQRTTAATCDGPGGTGETKGANAMATDLSRTADSVGRGIGELNAVVKMPGNDGARCRHAGKSNLFWPLLYNAAWEGASSPALRQFGSAGVWGVASGGLVDADLGRIILYATIRPTPAMV